MFDLSKQKYKEELYLTTLLTTSTEKKEKENENKRQKMAEKLLFKKKLKLPQIKFQNTSTIGNISRRNNINPYFSPENYHHFTESCNKYVSKLDPVIKDCLSPKNIIMRTRKYDINENKMLSDLKRDDIINRSAGKGIFFRILKYKNMRKKKPFKLIFRSVDYNNNERFIKKINRNKEIKNIKNKNNKENLNGKEIIRNKYVFSDNEENMKPMNELLWDIKPPKITAKTIDHSKDFIKMGEMENKTRDQRIINALMKSGDSELKFNIGAKVN
jgi:hypothetical protein